MRSWHERPATERGLTQVLPEDHSEAALRLRTEEGTPEQRALQVLADPTLPAPVLAAVRLASPNTSAVAAAFVRHPSLRLGQAMILGRSQPEAFLEHPVARLHLATTPDWLYTLPGRLLAAVVASPACPPEAPARLARDRSLPAVARAAAAARPDIDPALCPRFFGHTVVVRVALARNPTHQGGTHPRLSSDPSSAVRAAVAENTREPQILEALSRDRSLRRVRVAVAGNPATPEGARAYLSRSRFLPIQVALERSALQRGTP